MEQVLVDQGATPNDLVIIRQREVDAYAREEKEFKEDMVIDCLDMVRRSVMRAGVSDDRIFPPFPEWRAFIDEFHTLLIDGVFDVATEAAYEEWNEALHPLWCCLADYRCAAAAKAGISGETVEADEVEPDAVKQLSEVEDRPVWGTKIIPATADMKKAKKINVLAYKGLEIVSYAKFAKNQFAVLNSLQESGWPRTGVVIDLPANQLCEAIREINDKASTSLSLFREGQAIFWADAQPETICHSRRIEPESASA